MTTTEPGANGDAPPAQAAPASEQAPAAPTTRSVTIHDPGMRREVDEMQIVRMYGRLMAASGFFEDTRSEAQAAVKILAGRELGFSALASMTGFHIIDGKVTASAQIMAHAIKRSGKYEYRVVDHTALVCALEFYEIVRNPITGLEHTRERLGESVFSIEDANLAGLLGRKGQMWEKYPRNMLFARAMSNGIGWFCPDVFDTRVYTPDEIRPDLVLDQSGEVMDVESIIVIPRDESPPREERREPQPPRDRGPSDNRRPVGQPRPARQPQTPRAAGPAPDAATTPRMENLGHLLTWAVQKPRVWKPDEVARRLGVDDLATITDYAEAYRKLLLSDGVAAPVENDTPYPWYPEFVEALAGWGEMKAEDVLIANDEEVSAGEPYESIFARLDLLIRGRPDMTVEAIVEQAADYLARMEDDEALPTEPEDASIVTEPPSDTFRPPSVEIEEQ